LVQVGTMTVADIVGHPPPPVLVDFSEMRFVLGIDDPDRAPADYDYVRDEVAERAVARVRPVKRPHCFTEAATAYRSASSSHFLSHLGLNVVLPKSIERHRPSEPIHLSAPAETAFIAHPPNRIETASKSLLRERVRTNDAPQDLGARVHARHIVHAFKHP
jgi:hypothetical protein